MQDSLVNRVALYNPEEVRSFPPAVRLLGQKIRIKAEVIACVLLFRSWSLRPLPPPPTLLYFA